MGAYSREKSTRKTTLKAFLTCIFLVALTFGGCGGGDGDDGSTSDESDDTSDQFTVYKTQNNVLGSATILSSVSRLPSVDSYVVDQSKLLEYESHSLYTVFLRIRRSTDLSEMDTITYDYTDEPYNYDNEHCVHAICMADSYVYDFDSYDLFVYDISSSRFNLVDKTNSFSERNFSTEALLYNGFLYVFGNKRADVFNISNPAHPEFIQSLDNSYAALTGHQMKHCAGFVNNFYVVNNDNEIAIYSLGNGNPTLTWYGDVGHSVAIGNSQIFVDTGEYIDIYRVDSNGRPYLSYTTSIERSGNVKLSANDNFLFVYNGGHEYLPYSNFALYDISIVDSPTLIDAVIDSHINSNTDPFLTDMALFMASSVGCLKFDVAENDNSDDITTDSASPSVPTNFTARWYSNEGEFEISWSPSTDNISPVDAIRYQLYIDGPLGVYVGWDAADSYINGYLDTNDTHCFAVSAIDEAGNESEPCNEVCISPYEIVIGTNKIPDTGQIQSYTDTFGEDSDYLNNQQSYTKLDILGNDLSDSATEWAMVRDNVTGLIWEVKTDDGSIHDRSNTYNWEDSKSVFVAQLNDERFGGNTDWRMPTVKELSCLVNRDNYEPTINTSYFPNTVSGIYWTSTDSAHEAWQNSMWGVFFNTGQVYTTNNRSLYVRAVRNGN